MESQGIQLDEKTKKRLKQVAVLGNTVLYEYLPSLFRPLLVNFEPMSFVRRCRYLLEYMHRGHYRVYYLADHDTAVGFCVVVPGGRKLKLSSREDIVLGPYFVAKSERGKGYSKTLIRAVLEHYPKQYRWAFDWILNTNEPSKRASESCGFRPVASLNITGLMRTPVVVENGMYTVYRYDRQK